MRRCGLRIGDCGIAIVVVALVAWPGMAQAKVKSEPVEYHDGETVLEGYVAYDDAGVGARPGVLVVHEWWGLNQYAKQRAEQLAKLGYIAFAADMYGKGQVTEDPKQAGEWATAIKSDRALMRRRAHAGLEALRKHPLSDDARLAAIGYCFGGTAALELARSGADFKGAVSFHGGLGTPDPTDASAIKARILALHGGDDPHVPPAEVEAFQQEMRKANVSFQMIVYPGAVHGFTNPNNDADPSDGVAYDKTADQQSWTAMRELFDAIF